MKIADNVCLTATIDILRAIARGTGPAHAVLALGYAGWSSGQLESEILANGWLTCPADPELIFDADFANKYDRALAKLGVDVGDAVVRRRPRLRAVAPHPRLGRHLEHLGPSVEIGEGGRVGAGQEHLAAEALERVEQRGAAARIEMRGDLVEQRDRRDARHVRDQARMGEHQPDQQRLLLAGRGAGGRRVLRPVPDGEIADMRADQRAAGGGVAAAIVAQAARGSGPRRRAPGRSAASASTSPSSASRAQGKGEASSRSAAISASSRLTHSSRAAATATPSSAASRSIASSQRGVAPPPRAAGCARATRARTGRPARRGSGSIASTNRSRNRRRSLAGPENSESIAGVSQTTRTWSEKARDEATGAAVDAVPPLRAALAVAGLQPEPS